MKKITHLLTLTLLSGALTIGMTSCRRDGGPKQPGTDGKGGGSTQVEVKKATDLQILEVFYAGSKYTRTIGKKTYESLYEDDQFIKIYNPTDEVKYLDGMLLATGTIDPQEKIDIKNQEKGKEYHLTSYLVGSMIQFPGSGKEHAVKPGEAVIIAKKAINHKKDFEDMMKEDGEDLSAYDYKSLIDLSGAAYTWSEAPEGSKAVYLPTIFKAGGIKKAENAAEAWEEGNTFEIDGTMSLALIRPKTSIEEIKKTYLAEAAKPTKEQSKSTFFQLVEYLGTMHNNEVISLKIPNDQVIDAVVVCPMGDRKMQVLSQELDKGSHGVAQKGDDKEKNAGKAIVRKWNGKTYEDQNNSTSDFEVKPVNPTTKLIKE